MVYIIFGRKNMVINALDYSSSQQTMAFAELLNSQRMKTLLDTVKGIYDMVIVDVPPMLEVTDTQILSRHLDAVVLVVKQGQTQKLAVKRAVELLNLAHANLLGYVMNDVNANGDAAYGYGYGYGYGEDANK